MKPGKIVVGFAGGGGSSTGIRQALGRDPDLAINHSPWALAMHAANHPGTRHIDSNIYRVDPREVCGRDHVAAGWFSPDCKDFSKAKGGTPVRRNIRDLAWVVDMWADRTDMELFFLENVEEFAQWGPTVWRDGKEYPDPERRGETFKLFIRRLKSRGFKRIEWRELRGCDYGDPTIRRRLFMIGRRDGEPIMWPRATHGAPSDPDVIAGRKLPWRTAAEFIDWSLDCPSIFMTREEAREYYRLTGRRIIRPLAENTLARVGTGVWRYVIDAAEPFIVPVTHSGDFRCHSTREPLRTITTAKRGEHALVTAFLAQHNLGVVGHDVRKPLSTLTVRGTQQQLVAAHLLNLKGSARRDAPADGPCPTICAGGGHLAQVSAFLVKYYGQGGQWQDCREPMHTDTTKPRMGVVMIHGEPYAIADIGMRMLTVRERFNMQGFPPDYVIDVAIEGKRITAEQQGACCGNAVNPGVARALVLANCAELIEQREAA